MFFFQNTSAQFKMIDSLIKSSNMSDIAFVQIQPIKRHKSSQIRRFVATESMEFIKIHTEPPETIQKLFPLNNHIFQTKSRKFEIY